MKWIGWLMLWVLPWLGRATEIPDLVLPAGVGVNIHFVTGHEKDLDLIAGAGFKFIRMDFGWESIERTKGQYDWSAYEELMRNLDQRGLHAVFILDYSNPLYEETVSSLNPLNQKPHRTLASPQHPESVAAYAAWAAASAKHFHGRHIIWELWNEPNIQFWNPKPDVNQYTTLALAAARAIRQTEPEATVVGPASSGFPWDFLEHLLQSGVLEYLDAVSVHPYRQYQRPPESAAADYQKLHSLIDRFAPASKKTKLPILSGEWGYATHTKGVSLATQAAFAVRQQLANLLNGIPLSIWYDWKNDGTNPDEREDNFGTVQTDLQPKPAYLAIRTLTQQLAGYRLAQRLALESDQDYALLFSSPDGSQKLVAWTLGQNHQVALNLLIKQSFALIGVRGYGQAFSPTLSANHLTLDLSPLPQYLNLEHASIPQNR